MIRLRTERESIFSCSSTIRAVDRKATSIAEAGLFAAEGARVIIADILENEAEMRSAKI